MQAGYSDEEITAFTKTERRILILIHDMKYDRPQIRAALDIKDTTYRGHMARIGRKKEEIMKRRVAAQTQATVKKQEKVQLPDFVIGDEKKPEKQAEGETDNEPPLTVAADMPTPEVFDSNRPVFENADVDPAILPQPANKQGSFGSFKA